MRLSVIPIRCAVSAPNLDGAGIMEAMDGERRPLRIRLIMSFGIVMVSHHSWKMIQVAALLPKRSTQARFQIDPCPTVYYLGPNSQQWRIRRSIERDAHAN